MSYYEKYEERYQTVYAAGGDLWGLSPEDEALRRLLETWIAENALTGKAIVEFACGEGGAGKLLSDLGCRYQGFDLSPSAIATAQKLLSDCPNAAVQRLDLVQEQVPGHYDGALDAQGYHMLVCDQDRSAYLQNLSQCLNPGAPVLFYRELYQDQDSFGPVDSYDQWLALTGSDDSTKVRKFAKKDGRPLEVMIPRMIGRGRSEAGYREELAAAGLILDRFLPEPNSKRATIFAHKA